MQLHLFNRKTWSCWFAATLILALPRLAMPVNFNAPNTWSTDINGTHGTPGPIATGDFDGY
jgi:hypothetical protein